VSGEAKADGGVAAREAEELVHPAPGATDLLAALASGLVLAAYLVGGSAAAARSVAVAALPAALPLVSARCRRYAVYFYTVALGALAAGLFCCSLEPAFLAAAAFTVASFAWSLARHARRARLAQPQLRV
jgi:hypothetical protein